VATTPKGFKASRFKNENPEISNQLNKDPVVHLKQVDVFELA